MDRATFFKHFDLLADQPDAVPKLRKLILQLAVQGRIAKVTPGNRSAKQNLGAVIELISGQHLIPGEYNKDKNGIPYLTGPADFGPRFPTASRWTAHPKVIAQKGDILLTVKGAGVGKTNVVHDDKMAISRQLMAVRSRTVDSSFLDLSLRAAFDVFQAASNGNAIPGISREDVLNHEVWIPPLAERRRIVTKVDELMALCDELEQRQQARRLACGQLQQSALHHLLAAREPKTFAVAWQRVRDHFYLLHDTPDAIPQLRQTILQLAVQGRLVPQNSKDEPAEKLIAHIRLAKHRLAESSGQKQPMDWPAVESHELLHTFPNSWITIRLGDLVINIEAGFSPQCEGRRRSDNEWALLKISAVSWDVFDPEENKAPPSNIEPRPEYEVRDGDFLMSRANTAELVAKSVIAVKPPRKLLLNDKTLRVHFTDHNDKRFINFVNNSVMARAYYSTASAGTSSSMKNITREAIAMLPIGLPPLAEQKRIVARVGELMRWCDTLEAQLLQARTLGAHLLDSALHHLLTA